VTWPEDPDAVARLFYLALLLLGLLGFFAAGGRRRIGATAQQMLIWALIFAMVIIAYGFRDTLRAQLFPWSAVRTEAGAIELVRAGDGHFHATLAVDGAPVRFIVDTGASDVVLARRDAARVGIDVGALDFSGRAMTANGPVATARVRLGRVEFAGRVDTDVPASVTAGALEASLLGMAYLDRFARIEIVGDRMRLSY
jgi:aspartyl protease family protein